MSVLENLRRWFRPPVSQRRFPTVRADSLLWDVLPVPTCVVAIGDLQGDLEALVSILLERALIDRNGHWQGRGTHIVLLGDLVGGHEDSRLLLDYVIRLESEARAAGGEIHALLGNHDILIAQGEDSKLLKTERKLFEKYLVRGARAQSFGDLFRGTSLYAKWFRSRQSIIRIGKSLFVHAGVNEWLLENLPSEINSTIRAWIAYWQGVGEKPPKATRWTVGKKAMERDDPYLACGPLWTRAFKSSKERHPNGPGRDVLAKVLELYHIERIIVGHAPTENQRIQLAHPYYGPSIVMLDTRISSKAGGMLSSLEIRGETLSVRYTDRVTAATQIKEQELQKLKNGTSIHHPSLFSRVIDTVDGLFHRRQP